MEKELLHTYFRGNTTPEEEKLIMDWAEASTENHHEYLKERMVWNAILVNYKSTESQPVSFNRKRSFNLWKFAGIAASVALLITLSWTLLNMPSEDTEGLQAVLVPAGQRVQLILEDGTKVWLNSNSSFTYPTSFGSKSREVELNGEGFFEVTKDTRKPFIVKTKKYDIKVLGTTFNVYAYDHEANTFEAALLNGSIDVSSKANEKNHIILKTKGKVSEVDGLLRKQAIDNLDRFRWKDGQIYLDDVPFETLMEKFSLYYDVHIKIENTKVLNYHCTGKFRQSDGIEYALKVLQKDVKFSFDRDEKDKTILIK
ncbi:MULTISPECIES: FecR family protein [Parabacteroides]|uniref:FecR family protein n=1 Tax=Parabacteroides provencensis TaxID=1944636 RepID=UPI000C15FAE1|nr:FecR family protein [Parabacteroides provencensis]